MPLWRLASIASFEGSSGSVSTAPLCCRQLLLPLCGKCVPEFGSRVGHAFRNGSQAEAATRNPASEWDALSGTVLIRKLRPGIDAQNGTQFPPVARLENASQFERLFRDAVSAEGLKRKACPRLAGVRAQVWTTCRSTALQLNIVEPCRQRGLPDACRL